MSKNTAELYMALQAGPSVRHQCLQAMLRMMYYGTAELLHDVLNFLPISRLSVTAFAASPASFYSIGICCVEHVSVSVVQCFFYAQRQNAPRALAIV